MIYLLYLQCDRRFDGRMKYPLPNGKAVNTRIGKGGNGFVLYIFTMYYDRKQNSLVMLHSSSAYISRLTVVSHKAKEEAASGTRNF